VTSTIRNVRAGDRDAVYDICLRTADAGDDGTHLYTDPSLPGHVWAGAYVALEPEHGFVVVDDDQAIGYILGALDSRAFEAALERDWWPTLRARYPADDTAPSPGDRLARHLIHHPSRAAETIVGDFPSHLHIDLLPAGQGRGDGRRLVARLLDALRADGSPGVHLVVSPRNPGRSGSTAPSGSPNWSTTTATSCSVRASPEPPRAPRRPRTSVAGYRTRTLLLVSSSRAAS
jgi:GNAT superfamily N-acetyltransferase